MAHLEGTPTKPRIHNRPNTFYASQYAKKPQVLENTLYGA